jgi:hypothetical protein
MADVFSTRNLWHHFDVVRTSKIRREFYGFLPVLLRVVFQPEKTMSWSCLDHFHMSNELKSALIWWISHLTKHGYHERVFAVCHGSGGLLLLKLPGIFLLWIHTVHWICSWTCLDRFHILNPLKLAFIWWISIQKHGYYETVFVVCHGSGRLLLLKLLRIILLWIHTVHWMCSWTFAGAFLLLTLVRIWSWEWAFLSRNSIKIGYL